MAQPQGAQPTGQRPASPMQDPAAHLYHQRNQIWIGKQNVDSQSQATGSVELERSNKWLVFMIIAIISALLLFMMIPFIENFVQQEDISHVLENVKSFLSFAAPVLVLVSAISGTAGYFRIKYVAWLSLFGYIIGNIIFFFTINAALPEAFNFGIYWIIMGSFLGMLLGSLAQTVRAFKKREHRELIPLFSIAIVASIAASFSLVRFTTNEKVTLLTYQEVAERADFTLFEPGYMPEKFAKLEPKIFIDQEKVSVYYGQDHYPPPPVIDFLTGVEIVQTKLISGEEENILDPEPGVILVDVANTVARYSQRRGRATIEMNLGTTHVIMNVYSNMSSREMFKIADSLKKIDIISE